MAKKVIFIVGDCPKKLEDEIKNFFENNELIDGNNYFGQAPVNFDFIASMLEDDRKIPIENCFYKGISRVRKNDIYKQKSRLYNYRKK